MINCQKCDDWFHDECLGLSEGDVVNINEFYCPTCLEKDRTLKISYKDPPKQPDRATFCHCDEPVNGLMIECYKCQNWFHDDCLGLTESDMKKILLYFCKLCT